MKGVRLPFIRWGYFLGAVSKPAMAMVNFRFMGYSAPEPSTGLARVYEQAQETLYYPGKLPRKPRQAYLVSIAAWIL